MKKDYTLKNKERFNEVIKTGKKLKDKNYVVYFLPSFKLKIGISIGKKLGNAPFRNYHKRVIRSICQDFVDLNLKYDIVIIGRNNISFSSYEEKEKSLKSLIGRIENEKF